MRRGSRGGPCSESCGSCALPGGPDSHQLRAVGHGDKRKPLATARLLSEVQHDHDRADEQDGALREPQRAGRLWPRQQHLAKRKPRCVPARLTRGYELMNTDDRAAAGAAA